MINHSKSHWRNHNFYNFENLQHVFFPATSFHLGGSPNANRFDEAFSRRPRSNMLWRTLLSSTWPKNGTKKRLQIIAEENASSQLTAMIFIHLIPFEMIFRPFGPIYSKKIDLKTQHHSMYQHLSDSKKIDSPP